jgi:hypothetical protein
METNKKNIKWTLELLQEEALKYKTRGEFSKNSPLAYNSARYKRVLDKICSHMTKAKSNYNTKKSKEYTFDKIQSLALTCRNKIEFRLNHNTAYNYAKKQGIYDKIWSHLNSNNDVLNDKEKTKLYKENPFDNPTVHSCINIALKYTSKNDFKNNSPRNFNYAKNKGILSEVCSHMEHSHIEHKKTRYNEAYIISIAEKYQTKHDFRINDRLVYRAAQERGMLDELFPSYQKDQTGAKLPS